MPSTPGPGLDFSQLSLADLAQLRTVAIARQDQQLRTIVDAEWKRRERGWKAAPPSHLLEAHAAADVPRAARAGPEEHSGGREPGARASAQSDLAWRGTGAPAVSFCHVRQPQRRAAFNSYRLSRPHLLQP